MSWFKKDRANTPDTSLLIDSDELNAFDRLTQRAAVKLSRRSFLKKTLPLGAAGLGLALIGTAEAVSCTINTGQTCAASPPDQCVPCSGGHQTVHTDYKWFRCTDGTLQCKAVVYYYSCGSCIS